MRILKLGPCKCLVHRNMAILRLFPMVRLVRQEHTREGVLERAGPTSTASR
jgi:hypothetical protein